MKKVCLVILIINLILFGCSHEVNKEVEKLDKKELQDNTEDPKEAGIGLLNVKTSNFHSIVGWLGEFEIAYIEKEANFYNLKSFDLRSGVSKTIYTEDSLLIDVQIHPSKKFILLHTGSDSTSAVLKFITKDGRLQNEVKIESVELSIQWNDMNPSLLLFTAFREDWTYDLFFFDTTESDLVLLPIKNPFPKWLGQNKVIYSVDNAPLIDSYSLVTFDTLTGQQQQSDHENLQFFDTYNDHLLLSELKEEELHYTIISSDKIVESEWTTQYSGDSSEWFEPKIDWISTTELILHSTQSNSTSATNGSDQFLLHVTNGGETLESIVIDSESANCSPTGEWCLIGEQSETLINLKTNQKKQWLLLIP